MPTLLEIKERKEELYQRLIAIFLPVLAFYFGFVAHGLWPFGNKHLLAYDLYHQYAPFSFPGAAVWASTFTASSPTTPPVPSIF